MYHKHKIINHDDKKKKKKKIEIIIQKGINDR